jgi:hypothetical protein
MLSTLLLTCTLVNGIFDIDTIPHKWFLGFDQGLSARYFPKQDFGFGILVQPSNYYLVNKAQSSGTFSSTYPNSSTDGIRNEKTDTRGARLIIEGLYSRKLNNYFTFTPFINIGGAYESFSTEYNEISTHTTADTAFNASYFSQQKGSSKAFTASIGVMPGIKLGKFLFEFRLGLSGSYKKDTSPGSKNYSIDRDAKNIRLIYPSDVVHSLVIHLNL